MKPRLLFVMFGCWIVAIPNAILGNWAPFAVTALTAVMCALIWIATTLGDIASSKTHITFHPKPKA